MIRQRSSAIVMPTRRQFTAGLAASGLMASGVRAQTAPLKMVYYATFPPVCFEQDGKMVGILPEIIDQAAKDQGVALESAGLPWARAQAMVKAGEADAYCTNPTAERKEFMTFTKDPIYVAQVAVFYAADNPRRAEIETIKTRDDLLKFKQGDYNGNGFGETTFKGLDIDWSPNLGNTLSKVAVSRVDVFVGNETVAKYLIKENKIAGIKSFVVSIGNQSAFHFGVRKTYANAQQVVDSIEKGAAPLHANGFAQKVVAKYTE